MITRITLLLVLSIVFFTSLALLSGSLFNVAQAQDNFCRFTNIQFKKIPIGFEKLTKTSSGLVQQRFEISITGNEACRGKEAAQISLTAVGASINYDVADFEEQILDFDNDSVRATILVNAGEANCGSATSPNQCDLVLSYSYMDEYGLTNHHSDSDFSGARMNYTCSGSAFCDNKFFGNFFNVAKFQIIGTAGATLKSIGSTNAPLVCAGQKQVGKVFQSVCLDSGSVDFSGCKSGQPCAGCNVVSECKPTGGAKIGSCKAIYKTKCEGGRRFKCVAKRCEPTDDPSAEYDNLSTCNEKCLIEEIKNTYDKEVGSVNYKSPPSEPIEFSYKVPNLLEKNGVTNLAEFIDFILSNIMRFLIPLAVILIVYQGIRLLLNPILGAFGYNVEEKKIYKNILYVLGGLAIILVGRGFVTLILSIFDGLAP